jgi:hypothetical protein
MKSLIDIKTENRRAYQAAMGKRPIAPGAPGWDGADAEEHARQDGEVNSQRARDALRHAVDQFMNDLEIVGPELRTVIASLTKLRSEVYRVDHRLDQLVARIDRQAADRRKRSAAAKKAARRRKKALAVKPAGLESGVAVSPASIARWEKGRAPRKKGGR